MPAAIDRRAGHRSATGCCGAAVGLLLAACAAGPDEALAGTVDLAVAELAQRPELAGGRIGVCVIDAVSGDRLAGLDDDRGFLPASNQKLISAAVALETLGADHTMATELWWNGTVDGNVLHGDLQLRGHGDPTFGLDAEGREAFATFVRALRALGVTSVRGRVSGDGSWLGDERLGQGWQWDYLDEDYAAPFGGLCCAHNVVEVTVRPGDGAAAVELMPPAGFTPQARVQQGERGSATRLAARAGDGQHIVVTGSIAADAKEQVLRVPVPDPTAFAARVLADELRAAGIAVEPAEREVVGERRRLAAVRSPALAAIVRPMLLRSDNLYAEQVLRVASRVATGSGGTESARAHAKAVLEKLGIDTTGMELADGSGLSRRNLVRPRQLAGLLLAMERSPQRAAFAAGLPIAGKTGTLRERLTAGPASNRVRAKTGYIARVVCLSGYVPRPDPAAPPLVFSVMLNDFTCSDDEAKSAIDAFVHRLARAAGW